jgi:hypothetical protein
MPPLWHPRAVRTAEHGDPADHVLVPDLPARERNGLMAAIAVRCEGNRTAGWACAVTLREGGLDISTHHVRVWASDIERLWPSAIEPTALVKASFRFLLERESPHMILRAFDLGEIARYFPEYETSIRQRARAK